MNGSRAHILQMLQNKTITAEEADRLLTAIDDTSAVDDAIPHEPLPGGRLPHIADFRQNWRGVFLGNAFLLALSAARLLGLRGKPGFFRGVSRGFYGLLFALATIGAFISLWSHNARWLRVKIEKEDGHRFDLSLPVPVHLVSWLLRTLHPYVDAETAARLDTAIEMIRAMQDEMDRPDGQPIIIDVQDEGSRVQVYFV
jgi:hypothetical protein